MAEVHESVMGAWRGIGAGRCAALFGALYAGLTAWLVFATPLASGPDERDHLEYVDVIAYNHRLPLMPGVGTGLEPALQAQQAQHPPLYYLVQGLVRQGTLATMSPEASWRVLRCVSLLMGLGALGLTWMAGRRLWPDEPWFATVAVGFVGLMPETQYMTSVVSNSAGMLALVALTLWATVRLMTAPRAQPADWLVLGGALALTLFTKLTGLWLVPLVGICGLARLIRDRADLREWVTSVALFALPLVLLLGPWLLRNHSLYGVYLPERVTDRKVLDAKLVNFLLFPERVAYLLRMTLPEILHSYFTPYWLLRTAIRELVATLTTLLFFVPAVWGLVLWACRRREPREPLRTAFWGACLVGFCVCILVVLTLVVRDWNDVLYPGRYAWESASVVAMMWARGWLAFREGKVRAAGLGLTFAAMVLVALWVGNWVIGFFAQHPPV
jgi:hypothetical protein